MPTATKYYYLPGGQYVKRTTWKGGTKSEIVNKVPKGATVRRKG